MCKNLEFNFTSFSRAWVMELKFHFQAMHKDSQFINDNFDKMKEIADELEKIGGISHVVLCVWVCFPCAKHEVYLFYSMLQFFSM